MKNIFITFVAMALAATFISCSEENDEPTRVTITFEGAAWKNYVATDSYTSNFVTENYIWRDEQTTLTSAPLFTESSWGGQSYKYFSAGLTLSAYNTAQISGFDTYFYNGDLYCYNPKTSMANKGGGNNGSDNFLVTYGNYEEGVGEDMRPEIYFADGKARKVLGCYVCSTAYFVQIAENGNDYSPALTAEDEVKIYATGYDASGKELSTVSMSLAKKGAIVKSWTAWDLSALGEVAKIKFNIKGGPTDDWGMMLPKYFAIDDITVEL